MITIKYSINQTKTRTDTSYKSNYTLNQKIDALPTGAGWICDAVKMNGDVFEADGKTPIVEELELWRRNPVDCIRELIGNPAFRESMAYAPEQVYEDEKGESRIYDEMWTGDWWWKMQVNLISTRKTKDLLTDLYKDRLPAGSTIAPIILASDKTHLTNYGGDKSAWPVYLTLGNISKEVRRQPSSHATILVGYLPVSKFTAFQGKETHQFARYDAFHHCMRLILEPLIEAGKSGLEMICADGNYRHVFPILAAYVADAPEQALIACCLESRCPRCVVPANQRGDYGTTFRARNPALTLDTLRRHQNGENPFLFTDNGMRHNHYPFWADLPHADIFECITPDLLHQLHKGVFAHLVDWIAVIVSKEELDARFQCMSKYQALRHFKNGISSVSQWTGKEMKEMQRVFLGAIAGLVNDTIFAASKGLLDFIYLAQYQSHTDKTLLQLQDSLQRFHDNKHSFIEAGGRKLDHFNIPKLHAMLHYVSAIQSLGSADGFNSESPERLHIDYAKRAYQSSSRVDYIAQMTVWLLRQEAIDRRSAFLDWVAETEQESNMIAFEDLLNADPEDGDLPLPSTKHMSVRVGQKSSQ